MARRSVGARITSCRLPTLSSILSRLTHAHYPQFDDDLHDSHDFNPTRVLLVADPQVLNLHSYPDRSYTLSWLSEVFTDLNMRKSWKAVSGLHPDTTMFIGDMMDNGRAEMSDEECVLSDPLQQSSHQICIRYEGYYSRYHDIFETEDDEHIYYVPGNHDIG